MKVLVVAAHPDDEVLGCGGTIARLTKEGHEVSVAILGEGVTSRYPSRTEADDRETAELRGRGRQSASVLGVKEVYFFELPDNRFDSLPLLDIIKIIENLIEKIKPQVIYTHHGGDLNVDHVIVHRAVLTATRPVQGCSVQDIYAFEIPSSTEWSFQQFSPVFRPNVFEDISGYLDTKIRALSCYTSETRDFPHPRSPEALKAIARRWGSVVGCAEVEAFELIRSVRRGGALK